MAQHAQVVVQLSFVAILALPSEADINHCPGYFHNGVYRPGISCPQTEKERLGYLNHCCKTVLNDLILLDCCTERDWNERNQAAFSDNPDPLYFSDGYYTCSTRTCMYIAVGLGGILFIICLVTTIAIAVLLTRRRRALILASTCGYKRPEIMCILRVRHDIICSVRTVQRVLGRFNPRRHSPDDGLGRPSMSLKYLELELEDR
ncbi:uncharacterized protein LOC110979272 isoform X2 [Acanthaster planci]|uniref:Uncharacterized protein LOC110979272 isoform X2 n=1 Tax=Acanthaster planci TaxID=133434 RepID=A0A8B7YDH8_ACAPL|nr:uncharacterized protein LOC110979272 isoform X2 [Acanthaster planci]XP_022090617.1 uncharacterized protein LOC110979272 isoform X2 [Acanthaster planci]